LNQPEKGVELSVSG